MVHEFQPRYKLQGFDNVRLFVSEASTFDRMHTDLADLLEASGWLIDKMEEIRESCLDIEQIEDLLISIQIKYVEHTLYHLATFRADLDSTLTNISKLLPD